MISFLIYAVSGLTTASLNGQSYVIVTSSNPSPRPSPAPLADYLSLNFSTNAVHGLIIWKGEVTIFMFQ